MRLDGRAPRGGEASPARQVAAHVLLRVERDGAYANRALHAALERRRLDPRDRALATQLVYGTLRWQGRIDGWVERLAGRPVKALDPATRVILRLTGYQLLMLASIPPEAACDQAVRLAHQFRPQAAGLVNAICRRMSRREALEPPGEGLAGLAERHAHPAWLVERWAARVEPPELEAWLEANNRESPVAVRVNRLRAEPEEAARSLEADGFRVERGALLPGALRLHGGRIADARAFQAGWITPRMRAPNWPGTCSPPNRARRSWTCAALPGERRPTWPS